MKLTACSPVVADCTGCCAHRRVNTARGTAETFTRSTALQITSANSLRFTLPLPLESSLQRGRRTRPGARGALGCAGALYRDDVTRFDVEAGQVVVVAVILERAHLHRCRGICKTRAECWSADEQHPPVHSGSVRVVQFRLRLT